MDTENSLYEIMFILKPDLGEQKTQEELQEIKDLITSQEGEVKFEDVWGLRDFAYTIKNYDSGYYVVLNFSMAPTLLKEMDKPLILNQSVIRYLITKTPKEYAPISMTEYEEQWEKEEKEEKDKKEEDEKKKSSRRAAAPVKKAEVKKESKVEEVKPKEEKPKEEKPKEEKPKESTKVEEKVPVEEVKEVVEEEKVEKLQESTDRLKEVDEKLKNIINDPDISL